MKNRWAYLASCMLSMLCMGILYAWSILKIPFAETFSWTAGQLGLNFTLTISLFAVGGFFGGQMLRRTSERILLIASAGLVLTGFWGCSFLSGRSISALYLFYGCFAGFGIGVAYNVIVTAALSWFEDIRGTCSGLLMMCFGASTLLLGTCATSLFDSIGWRNTFRTIGMGITVVLLMQSIVLKQRERAQHDGKTGKTDIYRKPSFWAFCLYVIALAAGASMVISFSRDISLEIGVDEALATVLVGALAVCNGLRRLICGVLSDRISTTKIMLVAGLLSVMAACCLLYSFLEQSTGGCIAGMCATGIAYGFSPTVRSSFVAKTYSMKYFSVNFSLTSFTLIPCSFAATIGGIVATRTGGFFADLALSLVLALVSVMLGIVTGKVADIELKKRPSA